MSNSGETVRQCSPDARRQPPLLGRRTMKKTIAFCAFAAGIAVTAGSAVAADKPLIGIVSIAATEANNVRYINGAEAAAKELGWEISVIDAAGSADQANAGIQ